MIQCWAMGKLNLPIAQFFDIIQIMNKRKAGEG